ncbi:hypothetical protein [Notoacmeibacter ruber]|nr:hypothetical protein [Notoacmeibacter ruber]
MAPAARVRVVFDPAATAVSPNRRTLIAPRRTEGGMGGGGVTAPA